MASIRAVTIQSPPRLAPAVADVKWSPATQRGLSTATKINAAFSQRTSQHHTHNSTTQGSIHHNTYIGRKPLTWAFYWLLSYGKHKGEVKSTGIKQHMSTRKAATCTLQMYQGMCSFRATNSDWDLLLWLYRIILLVHRFVKFSGNCLIK